MMASGATISYLCRTISILVVTLAVVHFVSAKTKTKRRKDELGVISNPNGVSLSGAVEQNLEFGLKGVQPNSDVEGLLCKEKDCQSSNQSKKGKSERNSDLLRADRKRKSKQRRSQRRRKNKKKNRRQGHKKNTGILRHETDDSKINESQSLDKNVSPNLHHETSDNLSHDLTKDQANERGKPSGSSISKDTRDKKYYKSLANAERKFLRKNKKIQRRLANLTSLTLQDMLDVQADYAEVDAPDGNPGVPGKYSFSEFPKSDQQNLNENVKSKSNYHHEFPASSANVDHSRNRTGIIEMLEKISAISNEEKRLLEQTRPTEPSEIDPTRPPSNEKSSKRLKNSKVIEKSVKFDKMDTPRLEEKEEAERVPKHKLRHRKKKESRRGKKKKMDKKKNKDVSEQEDEVKRDPASERQYWRQLNFRRNLYSQGSTISDALRLKSREFISRAYDIQDWIAVDGMKKIDEEYAYMFKGTRIDMMMGARNVLEVLSEANNYIYDGVTRLTDYTRNLYMQAHRSNVAHLIGHEADSAMHEKVTMLRVRDFRDMMRKVHEEENQLRRTQRELEIMRTKCLSETYQLENLRKKFLENYDRAVVKDIFENLRETVYILNEGFSYSPKMWKLRAEKRYIDNVRQDLLLATDIVRNSTYPLRDVSRTVRENYDLFTKWQSERQRRQTVDVNIQSDEGVGLTNDEYQRLQFLVQKAKLYQEDLSQMNTAIQRNLSALVKKGKISNKSQGQDVDWTEVYFEMNNLEKTMKVSYEWLDKLRMLIGSDEQLTYSIRCKPWLTDDEDELCNEEGSGEGSGAAVGLETDVTTDDEDGDLYFTDDGKEVVVTSPSRKKTMLVNFKVDLMNFTTHSLKHSEHLLNKAQSLEERADELKARWTQSNRGDASSMIQLGKEVIQLGDEVKEMAPRTQDKIKEITQKLDDFDEIDLEGLVSKAKQALEQAKTSSNGNEASAAPTPETSASSSSGGYTSIIDKVREVKSQTQNLVSLNSQIAQSCGKFNSQFNNIHGNISLLRDKINTARKLLSSLQVSVVTSGKSYIPVNISGSTVGSQVSAPSIFTSFSLGFKPTTLDGTLLAIRGNNSVSYSVVLDDGEVKLTVYDREFYDIDDVSLNTELEKDKWYFVSFTRHGSRINLSLMNQEGPVETKTIEIDSMPLYQPLPAMAFVGGVPKDSYLSDEGSWQGCIGKITVNGHSLPLVAPHADGGNASVCDEHISTKDSFSTVFDGNGFVHFKRSEMVNEISLSFRTFQRSATLLSLRNKNRNFDLIVSIQDGAVKVESSSTREKLLLLSLKKMYNDGQHHTLQIKLVRNSPYPTIDGDSEGFSRERERPQIPSNIINGVVIGSFISDDRTYITGKGSSLIGCIGNVNINQEKLFVEEAFEVYNAYQGNCHSASMAHSCWSFSTNSQPVALGSVDKSNVITILVANDALGSVLYYERIDESHPFKAQIIMTADGLEIKLEQGSESIQRPEDDTSLFSLITVIDDGNDVEVKAWGDDKEVRYYDPWWFEESDLTLPHNVTIGGFKEGEDNVFTGAVSYFSIGERVIDLSSYSISHGLSLCNQPTGTLGSPLSLSTTKNQTLWEPLTCM